MYNIYDLIPSKDVSEFNKTNRVYLNPTEMAIIINNNERISLTEKIKLIRELLKDNKPEYFNIDISSMYCENIDDPYITIKKAIEYKEEILYDSNDNDGSVYELTINEYYSDKIASGDPIYFSSIQSAYDYLKSYYEDIENQNIELYSRIVKIKLNSEYCDKIIYLYYNTIMINIYGNDGTTFDTASFYIHHQFKKGDIVKYKSCNGLLYGVIPNDITIDRYPNKVGNFYSSLDSYDLLTKRFYYTDWTEYIYFEKCSIDDLPENMNVLILLSDVHTGKLDILSLLQHVQNNTFEKLANKRRLELLDNIKLSKDTVLEV